ncbi:MAG: MAPEG family protein [Dehalococcoidia bacterium]
MPVVALYAALLSLLFIGLSARTIGLRRRLQIGIGDAGSAEMLRAMRVYSNFAEYVPLALLLIYFAEVSGAPHALVHALGLSLLLGRLVHAYGVSQVNENFRFRVVGMVVTFSTLGICAGYLLLRFGSALVG